VAKKKPQEDEIRRGLDALRKAGVPIENVSAEIVSQLATQLGKTRETDLAVVSILGRVAADEAVQTLVKLEKESEDKLLRKEIRRSLFKLSQKGAVIPEEKRAQSSSPILSGAPEIEAYLSSVDSAGGRLVWIAKPQLGHGLQLIQGMLSDRQGLLRIGGAHVRRKELRKMAEEIKKNHNISMISVPWDYADAMLFGAYEQTKAAGGSGVEQFHELRSIINTGKPKSQEHPIYGCLDCGTVREGPWRERSRRLLDEAELRFWILDDDWMKSSLSQLEEAKTSPLVLNPLQKEERMAGIAREGVKTLFTPEIGPVFRRRMEDMALYFLSTDRRESAELALAIACQIKTGDPGPLDISFLTGLVQKSFAFYLSQEQKKPDQTDALIVKP
jgi:hypothetical protein